MTKYGWCLENSAGSAEPVGRLKPNDFGLFDMHGNVWCWCQDVFKDAPQWQKGQVLLDAESDELNLVPDQKRAMRGACQNDGAERIRSDIRYSMKAGGSTHLVGFRVARTITVK